MRKPKSAKSRSTPDSYYKPNIWASIRDICTIAINKGQFPLIIGGIALVVLICRLPQEDLSLFAHELFHVFETWHILGWVIAILELGGWWWHSRYQRKIHTKEVRRIARHKKELETRIIGKDIGTSDK